MARVNVEQKAITDPRFYRLGVELGAPDEYAQAFGLFAMIKVWNECIERGKYTLDAWVIQALLKCQTAPEKITGCDLASATGHNRFRIKGTKGRVEYLETCRRIGRQFGHLGAEHGKKGGRPRNPPTGVLETPHGGMQNNPLPAPAPAPVLKKCAQPPSVEEVRQYCIERKNNVDAQKFVDFYTANGWMQGRGKPIRDWKAAVRTWESNDFAPSGKPTRPARDPTAELRRQQREAREKEMAERAKQPPNDDEEPF